MQKRILSFISCSLLLLLSNVALGVTLKFDSKSSVWQVDAGTELKITNPITGFDGTLVKKAGGTISGQTITFENGCLQDEGNQLLLSAIFNPTGEINLVGNDRFRAEPGNVLQAVKVSGSNNRLEGQPVFSSTVQLLDVNTTLTLAVQSAINQNIDLNGGTICLADDLTFASNKTFLDSGTIQGKGYKVVTGNKPFTWDTGDIFWTDCPALHLNTCVTLNRTFTFNGASTINGHGNVLELENGGRLVVASNSTLYLTDLVLKGLGAGGGDLVLLDGTSQVVMTSVDAELIGDQTTSPGDVLFKGPATLIVKDHTWTFSSVTVDGVTVWKDQAGAQTLGDVLVNTLDLVASGTIKALGFIGDSDTIMLNSVIDHCCSIVDDIFDDIYECCSAKFVTKTDQQDDVETADWSFDSKFVAIGLDNSVLSPTMDDQKVLKNYKFDGTTLTLADSFMFPEYREIAVVRYNPINHLLAVGRTDAGGGQGLVIFSVDSVTGSLMLTDSAENMLDVRALAWHPDGDRLAIASSAANAVKIYAVDGSGNLGSSFSGATTGGQIQVKALDFDVTGSFLGVGVNKNSPSGGLQVWTFDKAGASLVLTATKDVIADGAKRDVRSVAWNKECPSVLAAGLAHTGGGELVQIFEHNGPALIGKTGIDNLGRTVRSLHWATGENCLGVGLDVRTGFDNEFRTYAYDKKRQVLELRSFFDFGTSIEEARFSPNNKYVANGGDNESLSAYKVTCLFLPQLDRFETCIDTLKTSTGFLQLQIDSLSFIDTQVDISNLVSCVDELKTSTGFLRSIIDSISLIDTQVDISDLTSCVDALKTSTGFLQSQIDGYYSNASLETYVDALKTSTGELQSQIDLFDCKLRRTRKILSCDIDELHSIVDAISFVDEMADLTEILSCIDGLKTSTGELRSIIDDCCKDVCDDCDCCDDDCCPVPIPCCTVEFKVKVDQEDDVESSDWSFDDKFIALGLDNQLECPKGIDIDDEDEEMRLCPLKVPNHPETLKIYCLENHDLTLTDSFKFDEYREVSIVRWHPSKHLLAVGRLSANGGNGLHIFSVDMNGELTEVSAAESDVDVVALAWHPTGEYLFVGREVNNKEIAVYPVDMAGNLGMPVLEIPSNGTIQTQAMDLDKFGLYLAVGLDKNATGGGLHVYLFDDVGPSLTLHACMDVLRAPMDANSKSHVRAVDWNHACPNLLAVGVQGAGELVQVFEHRPNEVVKADRLVQKAIIELCETIRNIDWSPNGKCLALGKNAGDDGAFQVYFYDKECMEFELRSEFDDFDCHPVETVRWSHDGLHIINGSDFDVASLYRQIGDCDECPCPEDEDFEDCCDELRSRVEELEECCDDHETRLDDVESELDDLIFPFDTRIEALESCCDNHETRLVIQEMCCDDNTLTLIEHETRIVELESCCDALDSRVDVCCDGLVPPAPDEIIDVPGELCLPSNLLPTEEGKSIKFRLLSPLSKVIFDPGCTGDKVIIPRNTCLTFCGPGRVCFLDGIRMCFLGDADCDDENPQLSKFALTDGATMGLDNCATVTFAGDVNIVVNSGSSITLNQKSVLILGDTQDDVIDLDVLNNSQVAVDHPDARMSFQLACYDIDFDMNSTFTISRGIVEFNKQNLGFFRTRSVVPATGHLRRLHFDGGSTLVVGHDGAFCWAKNRDNLPVDFDNTNGSMQGCLEFRQFNEMNGALQADLKLQIEDNAFNSFSSNTSVFETFLTLIERLNVGFGGVTGGFDGSFEGMPADAVALLATTCEGLCVAFCGLRSDITPTTPIVEVPCGLFKVTYRPQTTDLSGCISLNDPTVIIDCP